jgi:hypothetical protein
MTIGVSLVAGVISFFRERYDDAVM